MIFLTILLDALAAGLLCWQRSAGFGVLGLLLEAVFTVVLLVCLFAYRGKRRGRFNFDTWSRVFTLPYALIVLSFIANGILTFLYYLNYTGANALITR